MRQESNQDYLYKRQGLSSLVLNLPYTVDGFTTAPKIAKILSLPLGIKIEKQAALRCFFGSLFLLILLMTVSCLLALSITIPVQIQNKQLTKNTQRLTYKRLTNIAKVQEASSYNKLFQTAKTLSLKDPQEVIYIKSNAENTSQNQKKLANIVKYPSFQFAGF